MSEEFIDFEKAAKIAADFVKGRFETISEINIESVELTEVTGIPIYKVEGKAKTKTEIISVSAQVDAKTGRILGFRKNILEFYGASVDIVTKKRRP